MSLPREEDGEYNKICEEHNHLMQTLPKAKGWWLQYIYNYNCFWLNPDTMKSNLLLKSYFRLQPFDIFFASFMKSGTTWIKALMFSTINRHRFTFSDDHLLHNSPHNTIPHIEVETYPITDYSHLPPPRLFATHYAWTILPPSLTSCKFVYFCRDRKDVSISKWCFMAKLRTEDLLQMTLDEAFELFCQGISEFGPYWDHVLSYEDIKKQPMVELRKLVAFMGKPFTAEEEEKGVVEEIVNLCSFENLSNLEVNKTGVEKFGKLVEVQNKDFFSKCEIGDWKNHLSEKMRERINRVNDEKLKGSGLILGAIV